MNPSQPPTLRHDLRIRNARRRWVGLGRSGLSLLCATVLAASAHAQTTAQQATTWPGKPVRAVIAYPPAGAADIAGRIVGQALAARLGQPLVPDNHPGAVGTIGATLVARAAPDGHTLLAATNPEITIVQHLRASVPYDADRDLVPLFRTSVAPVVLVARAGDAATANLKQMLERARATPDRLSYATPGVGTPMHLMMEGVSQAAGVRLHHVPYNGGARATVDLMGGQIDMLAVTLSTVFGQLQSGQLKALAVLQAQRSPLLPDVPTWKEAAGSDVLDLPSVWFGWFAPARTPPAIRARLSAELEAVAREPAVQDALRRAGLEPSPLGAEPFARQLKSESAFFARAARPFAER